MPSPTARILRPALFAAAAITYAATAPGGAFWLDSGELAAAGATLGVPHAPGHPVYVILAHAASLVPLGPVAFRVALLSALTAAWAVVLTFDLALRTAEETSPARDSASRSAPWVAAVVSLAFAGSAALWLQANRAEVYTLHLALALLATRLAWDWRTGCPDQGPPLRRPLLAAFLVGLGGANHHLLMVFHLPAVGLLLVGSHGHFHAVLRRAPTFLAFGLLGLACYVLLPLRAAHDPLLDYGSPDSLGRFVDVVTARVFQPSVTRAATSVTDNAALALEMALFDLGPVLLVAALIGAGRLAYRRSALALALVVGLGGNLATKLLMDVDPTNPDDGGYFQMAWAMTAVLAAPALMWPFQLARPWRLLGLPLLGLTALMGLVGAAERMDRVALASVGSPAAVDALLLRQVLPGAVVMPSFYALHFNRLFHAAVEGARPDVTIVHQSFEASIEGGQPLLEALRRRAEPFADVVEAFVTTGRFPTAALLELAHRRPIYLEPTLRPQVPVAWLAWAGGLWRVLPAEAGVAVIGPGAQDSDATAWVTALGAEGQRLREARSTATLLWVEIATTRLSQGDGAGALAALETARRFTPGSPFVERLLPLAQRVAAGDPDALDFARRADWSSALEAPGESLAP